MDTIDKKRTKEKLKQYLLSLLTKRDYARQKLVQKATEKGYNPQDITESVQELEQLGFVDDKRFAENIAYYYSKIKGRLWISQKMMQKGVPRDIAHEVLEGHISPISTELKHKITTKYHIDNWAEIDQKTKQKVLGSLVRLGYDNAWEIIRQWQEEAV